MTNNPKVTIIIPVFNGSNYLAEAIDSALAQTYKNIEIIVVNDGSNDHGKTNKIALSYNDKIKYFKKDNGGVSSALNFGIKNMTGEYFSWLSHDDIYLPKKIETEINFLIINELITEPVILYSDYYLIDEKSNIINNNILDHLMLTEKPEYSLLRGAINGLTLLIPKSAFNEHGLFNENLKCVQDYALWHKMFKTYKPIHIPELLVCTRIHKKQTTNTDPDIILENDRLWIQMIEDIPKDKRNELEGSEYFYYFNMIEFLRKYTLFKGAENHCNEMLNELITRRMKVIDVHDILVSVIIPFYNRSNETIRAIKSVLSQTHKYYEILLINDHSNEDISQIIEFIKDNVNIKLFHLPKNLGPAGARNVGIKFSKGEYISFLDSDDEYLHNKLEIQVKEMIISDAVISHTSYFRKMDDEGIIINSGFDKGDIKRKYIYSCPIATPTIMIKRKYIIDNKLYFNEKYRIGEDICYWLEILKKVSILGIEEPYTIVNTSYQNSAYDNSKQIIGTKNILKFLLDDEFYSNYDLELSYILKDYFQLLKKKCNNSQKKTYIYRLFQYIKNHGIYDTYIKIKNILHDV